MLMPLVVPLLVPWPLSLVSPAVLPACRSLLVVGAGRGWSSQERSAGGAPLVRWSLLARIAERVSAGSGAETTRSFL
eukprot:5741899-Pyramimonas_sp.AAC.1